MESEDAILFDMPVVLSASRLPQSKSESPAAVTVIDRDMIRASGARQVADLFRFVPGFQVSYAYDSQGLNPVVTYHGLSDAFSRRLQVLVDGRSVYSVFIGGVFWSDLPLAIDDIDRIEVIRGPNAAAYGSNAFFGVINIVTLDATHARGTLLNVAAGEHDIRDGFARGGWKTKNGDVRLTVGYQGDNGLGDFPDASRARLASMRGDFQLSMRDSLEVQLGVSDRDFGVGFEDRTAQMPRDSDATASYQQLRWRRVTGMHEELSVQLFHHYWRQDQDYETEPLDLTGVGLGVLRVPVSFDAAENRYDFELQHLMAPSADWRLVWGIGARRDSAQSRPYFATDQTLVNRIYRVFANTEWRVRPSTTINVGVMAEKNELAGRDLSPRLALNQQLSANHSLRLAASSATRAPTLIEKRGDNRYVIGGLLLEQEQAPAGNLASERLRSYEFGYFGWALNRQLAVDLRVYHNEIRRLITEIALPAPTIDGEMLTYRNEGEAIVRGAELQLDYRPRSGSRIYFTFARMYIDADGFSDEAIDNEADQERSVPRFSGSLLLSQRFAGHWQASAAYYRAAAFDWLGSGDAVDREGRLDLRLAREFRLAAARGEVALVVQNVGAPTTQFNEDARFDRRAFINLRIKY